MTITAALVFETEADCLAALARVTSNGRALFVAAGYILDGGGSVVGKDLTNTDRPDAQAFEAWDTPSQAGSLWWFRDPRPSYPGFAEQIMDGVHDYEEATVEFPDEGEV